METGSILMNFMECLPPHTLNKISQGSNSKSKKVRKRKQENSCDLIEK